MRFEARKREGEGFGDGRVVGEEGSGGDSVMEICVQKWGKREGQPHSLQRQTAT